MLLVGLQLPLGILNLMIVIKEPNRNCFDCMMPGSVISLRQYWRFVGIFEIIIAGLGLLTLLTECIQTVTSRFRGMIVLILMFGM